MDITKSNPHNMFVEVEVDFCGPQKKSCLSAWKKVTKSSLKSVDSTNPWLDLLDETNIELFALSKEDYVLKKKKTCLPSLMEQ